MDYTRIDQNLKNSQDLIWKIKSTLHVRREIIEQNTTKLDYKDKLIQHTLGEYACMNFSKLISTKEKKSKIQRALNIWKQNIAIDKYNDSNVSKEELQNIIDQLDKISQETFVIKLVGEVRDKHIAHEDLAKQKTVSVDFKKMLELLESMRKIVEPLLEMRRIKIYTVLSHDEKKVYSQIINALFSN